MPLPRIKRSLFWLSFFVLMAVSIIGNVAASNSNAPTAVFVVLALTGIIWLLVAAGRARDMGRSAWWALLTLVPVLGWGIIIWIGFSETEEQGE